jgi:aspartyl-tRNA(Asn)/glutamyl-tRNA(Gln) amidotransferase subunit B
MTDFSDNQRWKEHLKRHEKTTDKPACPYCANRGIQLDTGKLQSLISTEHPGKEAAKWLLNAGAKRANERGCGIHELGITPRQIAQIIQMRDQNLIGSNASDELFGVLCDRNMNDQDALSVATAKGMIQVHDVGQLDQWVEQAIAAQPQAAADYREGKDAAIGRLVGHVMKVSQGKADAKTITEKLRKVLRGG